MSHFSEIGKTPTFVGHSQGAIIIANAAKDLGSNVTKFFDLETYGGAARKFSTDWKSKPHYVHRSDLVPRLFGMGFKMYSDPNVYYNDVGGYFPKSHDFKRYINEQKWFY